MDPSDKKLLTAEQLCDILEVYLGRERGRAECHRLIDKMKDDPMWRAEMDTLGATVRVFQKVPCEKPPEDVCFRLMQVLNLGKDQAAEGDNPAAGKVADDNEEQLT